MSLLELMQDVSNEQRINLDQLRSYIIEEAKSYWDAKFMNTIHIPSTIVVEGHVYTVHHAEADKYEVDYDNKCIHLNKDDSDSEHQQNMIRALMEIVCYHTEIKTSVRQRNELANAWFRVMKINQCFSHKI